MKKILFVVAFALPLSMPMLSAQNATASKPVKTEKHKKTNTDAPSAVKTAFKKRFPTVTKVDYDKEKNGEYEAEFKLNGVEMSANFTADGTWRETESVITTTALPANVAKAIAAKYPTAKVVGAAKIETSDRGMLYEADLKTGMKKSEVLFDASGNVVK